MIILKRLQSLFRLFLPHTFRRLYKGGMRHYEIVQAGNLQFYLLTLPFVASFLIIIPIWLVPIGIDVALDENSPLLTRLTIGVMSLVAISLPLAIACYLLAPTGMDRARESKLLDMERQFKTEFAIGSGVIELKNTPDAHSLKIDQVTHITIRDPNITEHYQIRGKTSSRGPARHHKSVHHHSNDQSDFERYFWSLFIPDTFSVDVETSDYVMTVARMLPRAKSIALAQHMARDMGLKIQQRPRYFAEYEASFEVIPSAR